MPEAMTEAFSYLVSSNDMTFKEVDTIVFRDDKMKTERTDLSKVTQ